jgi:hypothetical protein
MTLGRHWPASMVETGEKPIVTSSHLTVGVSVTVEM